MSARSASIAMSRTLRRPCSRLQSERHSTSRDIATVVQGPKIRLGQIGKAIHREDGRVLDDDDVVEGIVLLQKGDDSDSTLDGIHDKGQRAQRPGSSRLE